ncbi:MAG TPA: SRPBCC family protein [Planctomycetaceae bacterium]|nr:SRPBCC family protein [Planctomycetaceae bacterium]
MTQKCSSEGVCSVERFNPLEAAVPNVGDVERALSLMTGAALAVMGVRQGRLNGLLTAGIGASLLYRGLTGHCQLYQALGLSTTHAGRAGRGVPAQQGVKIEQTMTIPRPADELYAFWRQLEQLPQVFHHLKSVKVLDDGSTRWVARGPFEMQITWDAEILNQRENRLIAWQSLPGGDIETAGSVRFRPLGDSQSTEVTVTMKYNPPAGQIGAVLASWFGAGLEQILADDLERFREHVSAQAATH